MNTRPTFFFSKLPLVALLLALGLSACTEQQNTEMNADSTAAMSDTSSNRTSSNSMSGGMSADSSASGAGVVQVSQGDEVGSYLTDGGGRTLYLFKKDKKGSGESACTGACAQTWKPYTVSQGAPSARGEAQTSMLGTLQRSDGARQVTYNGWPLYYFAQDQQPGDMNGQDVDGFGAEWYAVTPQGAEADE